MSLNGALQVARSGLTASQAAIQVAGNNMANASTIGFNRRTVQLTPARDEILGRVSVGQGVQLLQVRREVDTALQSRLRDALGQESGALVDQRFLTSIETLQNELTGNDLSSLLSEFFNAFSELANNPSDSAVRAVVIQQGSNVASRINDLRSEYIQVRQEVDRSLDSAVEQVNDILDRLELVNQQISVSESTSGEAAGLRDQRDRLLDELGAFVDISTNEQPSGMVDVFVGSLPVLLNGQSRGMELRTEIVDDEPVVTVRLASDGTKLNIQSGSIGALLSQRENTVQPVMDDLDTFSRQLIYQVNRLHSQGQGARGHSSIVGTVAVADQTAGLTSTAADLEFNVGNGSFFLHVTNSTTGLRTAHRIDVDGRVMSLDDVVNEINTVVGVPNVTASVDVNGRLNLVADNGFEMSFSDDSAGVLTALGIHTFFSGSEAADIAVNQAILDDSRLLAAGVGHVPGSNGTAISIADLQDEAISELSGASLRQFWQNSVNALAVRAGAANDAVETTQIVRESLTAQQQAISGVSMDEESINLLSAQRLFQAAAKFVSVIDQTMQVLLSIA